MPGTATTTRPLLRVATAGSVDDGKSTLIGRLLHDTGSIPPDQLEQIREATARRGTDSGEIDLALLTDGLRAEREQGITIDVAYRYFSLAGRDVILADTPGHEQYTRNMITGASTADVGLVLVDARSGLTQQSRRHAAICGLLRVPVIWCVNKLDLIDYDHTRFEQVAAEISALSDSASLDVLAVLPLSALRGDNIVERSENTDWHTGPTLFEALDAVASAADASDAPFRLPVQWVIRPQTEDHPDYRAYAGQIASGTVSVGDRVVALPSGRESNVVGVDLMGNDLGEAASPASVALRLEDDIDISRGDVLCATSSPATVTRELEGDVCWMSEHPLTARARLLLKAHTATVSVRAEDLIDSLDVISGQRSPAPQQLELNGIGAVSFKLAEPITVDRFADNRLTGAAILIDGSTNETVGSVLINKIS